MTGHEDDVFQITFRLWLGLLVLQLALFKSILGSLYYLQYLIIGPGYPDCSTSPHTTQGGAIFAISRRLDTNQMKSYLVLQMTVEVLYHEKIRISGPLRGCLGSNPRTYQYSSSYLSILVQCFEKAFPGERGRQALTSSAASD